MKLFTALVLSTNADVYLHMPRGSNNRLNERSTARDNANRLFDSQNNNNGGYNVADRGDEKAEKMSEQHSEMYFQSGATGSSFMNIEWFNQHGCGKRDVDDANAIDCHMIIQYKCENVANSRLRNGMSTKTPQFSDDDDESVDERKRKDMKKNNEQGEERGEHETWENYDACQTRQRNHGLFLADQNLRGESAIYTRQNANGNRRGYECPEERDYYPYWHPSEWTDVAVLTSNVDTCDYYQTHSSNSMSKGECVELRSNGQERRNHASKANNPADCEAIENAQWIEFYDYKSIIAGVDTELRCDRAAASTEHQTHKIVWGYPRQIGEAREEVPNKACLVLHPPVDCRQAPWGRANHLGNTDDSDDFASYRWKLPQFEETKECVLRMRYNISSDDYGEAFDSGDITPFYAEQTLQNDPVITTKHGIKLQLALNTAQIARTFQDRTHTFTLVPRDQHNIGDDETIENLQVRGKRGNIVQTFPAVEYDFSPQRTVMDKNSLLHIQWAGSNTNNKNNAGEGTAGTDRSNMVTMGAPNWNIPENKLEYSSVSSEEVKGKTWMVHRSEYREFEEAKKHCDSLDMQLPVPMNEDENGLLGQLEGGNFFLGISDSEKENRLVDIYTGQTLSFTKWARREPNNYTRRKTIFENGEDYVVFISKDKKWNDTPPNYNSARAGSVQTVCVREVNAVVHDQTDIEYLTIPSEEATEWTVHRSTYRPFDQAKNYCASIGMELPVPMSKVQNSAFGSIDGGNFYLGISDQLEEDKFVNVYTNETIEYMPFARGQPDDHTRPNSAFKNGEDFIVMLTEDREWNDAPNDFNNRRSGSVQTVCVKKTSEFVNADYVSMFDNVEWVWSSVGDAEVRESNDNLAVQMSSSGYYTSVGDVDGELDNQLNNAPASFHGNLIRFKQSGKHYFMSTRNNNFSNRAQKGDIELI